MTRFDQKVFARLPSRLCLNYCVKAYRSGCFDKFFSAAIQCYVRYAATRKRRRVQMTRLTQDFLTRHFHISL